MQFHDPATHRSVGGYESINQSIFKLPLKIYTL